MLLTLPAAADAAALDANKSCYPNGRDARLSGRGFAPDSLIKFTVNGKALKANVHSDSEGIVSVEYTPPKTLTELKLVIRATDEEGTSARTTIYVTKRLRVTADPPNSDDVRSWRAVFELFGFGHGRAFIHYLNPSGRLKKTVRLGRLRAPCGRLRTTRRRVMPFSAPQYGRWKLQFDTRRRYPADTVSKRVIRVKVFRG